MKANVVDCGFVHTPKKLDTTPVVDRDCTFSPPKAEVPAQAVENAEQSAPEPAKPQPQRTKR